MKAARPATLNVTAIPFRSSRLAIPPSPFSPRLPLTPLPRTSTQQRHASIAAFQPPQDRRLLSGPPPASPLHWVWQCHMCRIRYPLGATRRCLEDGHFFCAGSTSVKVKRGKNGEKTRVVRRHKACASEFDYEGWTNWATWRENEQRARLGAFKKRGGKWTRYARAVADGSGVPVRTGRELLGQPCGAAGSVKMDCWSKCNYPSECRWGPLKQSEPSTAPSSDSSPLIESDEVIHTAVQPTQDASPPLESQMELDSCQATTTFEGILEKIDGSSHRTQLVADDGEPKESRSAMRSILNALRLSASRRKSLGAPSPLAHESGLDNDGTSGGRRFSDSSVSGIDTSGDIIMGDITAFYEGSEEDFMMTGAVVREPEPVLMMPLTAGLPHFATYGQEIDVFEMAPTSDWEETRRKKDYAGHMESLRKTSRA